MNWFKLLTKIIYTTYESELTFIYEKVRKIEHISYYAFKEDMEYLEKKGLIKIQSVYTGVRAGKKNIVLATEEGELYCLRFFDSILQEREAERLLREHTTLEHGYFIKYCCDTFKDDSDYIVYDRYSDNKFITSLKGDSGKHLICESDFSIEYNGERYLFEAETGKCLENNTHQKLYKELDLVKNGKVNKTVFIICPSKKAVDKTQEEVDNWYRESEAYNDIDVVLLNASVKDKAIKTVKEYIKKEGK